MSTGLVANILAQFCVTVVIATLLSLLASFTIIPWLSSRFGKLEHLTGKNAFEKFILWFEKQLDNFTHWITDILEWCLKTTFRRIIYSHCNICCFDFIFHVSEIRIYWWRILPKTDRGQFLVQMELPKDATIEKTNQVTL